MRYDNPTPVQVGMSGEFVGLRYRVVGRLVLGMEEGGETYYWNEYCLVDDGGRPATLVYEEEEAGAVWKLFTLFEPSVPMTAEEAATKRVGDQVELDGRSLRVTLVDESRVFHIDGEAPEGVQLGDVAHYFNAEGGGRMVVVSWTGEEVEFYHGMDLPRGAVAKAFGLASELPAGFRMAGGGRGVSGVGWVGVVVALVFGAVILSAVLSLRRPAGRAPAQVKRAAPASPLRLGASGEREGKRWRIVSHAVVEVARVGAWYERHEYVLSGERGEQALLVWGFREAGEEWHWLDPVEPDAAMTPEQAAARRAGEVVGLGGTPVAVTEMFQSTVRSVEGESLPGGSPGVVWYGYLGRTGAEVAMVRWDRAVVRCYRGRSLPEREVLALFAGAERR